MGKTTAIDLSEVLDDLDAFVMEGCKKANAVENDGEEYEGRSSLEAMLTNSARPTSIEINKEALKMLQYYCNQDIPHTHNRKGELNLASIKTDWQKKIMRQLATKFEAIWDKQNVNKGTARGRSKKDPDENWKSRGIRKGKRAFSRVLVKKASRNVALVGQQALVGLLTSNANFNDPGFKEKFGMLMATDYGKAAIGLLASAVVAHIPGIPDDIKEVLEEELQADALDQFSMPIEDLVKSVLPMLGGAIAPLLGAGSSSSEQKLFASIPTSAPVAEVQPVQVVEPTPAAAT